MFLRDWRGGFCFEVVVVVVEGKYGDFLVEGRRAFLQSVGLLEEAK